MGPDVLRPPMSETTALAYYDAIDAGDYEAFADLLAPGVVHDRPDRTIEGRETLVEFMRDGRPNKGTSHEIRGVFEETESNEHGDEGDGNGVVVEGRLFDSNGDEMFGFVDVFAFDEGRIAEIRTYTD